MYQRIDDSEGDMTTGEASTWGGCWSTSHSQLNIVLLGGRNCGKSSVGNLLLGKEEFVTRERTSCSRRLGLASGRRLTVVDTPGWWCDLSAQDSTELLKREMRRSAALCPPAGPHVFLLTVKESCSAFTEKRRRALEEHVGLLGEQVWSHCLLVFTSSSSSSRRATVRRSRLSAAEKEEEEAALDWLRDKCGHRCHSVVLSDDDDDDDDDANDDVTELLDKIHKLITENGNRVFEMEEKVLQAAVEEKRGVEERAQQRFMRVKQHRALMQERSRPVTSIRMVLLGAKGSGKTSALNTILGRDGAAPPGRTAPGRTARCAVGEGVMFGRQLTVVDTPGWWMNYFSEDSTVFDQRELVVSLSLCPPGPHVFLLVIRVDRAFTETYGRAVQDHLQLFSRHIWSRVLVLFSFGDWLGDTTTEQLIESEGEPLRTLLDRCGDRYHVLNNKTRGDGFQVRELIGKMEEMLTGGDSYHYYEIERNVMEQLEARMRGERERAKERLMRKERWRQMAKSQLEKLRPLPELRLLLVGGSRTGKSSCGNTILSRDVFHTDTHTTSCAEARGSISVGGGSRVAVTVLDTPGGLAVTSDLLGDPASCALLLVVNVSCSFRDAHRQQLEKQLEAAAAGGGGDDGQMWSRRALVLFSHGDWLGGDSGGGGVERRIESEGAALQGLVDRCGNRYHVLDNKRRGDDEAQVAELLQLVQEMLAQERAADLHRGRDRVWRNVSAASCEPTGSSSSSTQTSPLCSGGGEAGGEAGGQIVAAAAGRTGLNTADRDAFMSFLSSLLPGNSGLRWTAAGQQSCVSVALPSWFPPDHDYSHHGSPRLNGESRTHHPTTMVLVLPQSQTHSSRRMMMLEGENGVNVNVQTLCHPALRQRTLQRLSERGGGLQQLLERWGDSSLEELEAFIDAYFEMVWEQTMGSVQEAEPEQEPPASEQEEEEEEEEEEVLTSIDRKLSKLELLEEIRSELSELRESLQHSWTTGQELRDKSRQEPRNTC